MQINDIMLPIHMKPTKTVGQGQGSVPAVLVLRAVCIRIRLQESR